MSKFSKLPFKFLFSLVFLLTLVFLLNKQFGDIPAIGPLLNPYSGIVQNERDELEDRNLEFKNRDFKIYFDALRIPHVFSENEADMHFAQGYVTAKDRLWQMDFISYVSAGRLSEIMGESFLSHDRLQRRVGMMSSVKKTLKFIESNPLSKEALDNYTAGVNAYILELDKAKFPAEYKLLGYEPEKWTNLKSVLIMKYVGAMLAGYEEDVSASYLLAELGEKDFYELYPDYKIETGDFKFVVKDVMNKLPHRDHIDYSFLGMSSTLSKSKFNPRLGSNAWAVSGEKSKSGKPILCNDPHLNLSFPSIWYEIQLKSNERNVYGHSIPGTPGVVIGFNGEISWGVTNGATDVRDWYKMDLKDDYSAYKMDDIWKPIKRTIEKIEIKGASVFYDTVYYSEHGPIVISGSFNEAPENKNYAMKWRLHDPSNEFLAILLINKSSNHDQFKKAIRYFEFPNQNFVYADTKGNISYNHQGAILKKEGRGDGKFIMDGSRSDHLFSEFLSSDELPQKYNPGSNYVLSANNSPWDSTSTNYVNGYYAELRANKISEILSKSGKFGIEEMKSMQLDNTNHLAELAVPVLLRYLNSENSKIKIQLENWDYKYYESSELALLFETWWELIEQYTWDELLEIDQFERYPDNTVLFGLINNEPSNKFFDMKKTIKKESAEDIISLALQEALSQVNKQKMYTWGSINKVSIRHLTQIDGLSLIDFNSSGHPNALNAISSDWGPSMRMIVEMADEPVAYGIIAGGVSGNPGSKYYDSFVDDWRKGNYHKMELYKDSIDAKKKSIVIWSSDKI